MTKTRPSGAPPLRAKATIRDVAAFCGVSTATVSNALSGVRPVNEETRSKVLEAAKVLGYTASTVARGLRMQRSWSVGFLIGDIANPYFPEVVRGAEGILSDAGYNIMLGNTDYQVEKQKAHLARLRDKQVDGLIVASQSVVSEELRRMSGRDFPVVFINEHNEELGADFVGVAIKEGMHDACTHLWNLGHRRIGFITGRAYSEGAQTRKRAFQEAAEFCGFDTDPALIVGGDFTYASGIEGARRLLALTPPPTAIVAANDLSALGVIDAAETIGVDVPGKLSVIGIDDIPASSLTRINLTTVQIPKWELGVNAARLILERIAAPDREPVQVYLASRFIRRGTTVGPS